MSINLVIGVGIGLVIGGFAVFVKMRLSQRFVDMETLVSDNTNTVFRTLDALERRLDRRNDEITKRIEQVAEIVNANVDAVNANIEDTTGDFEEVHRRMDFIETSLDELTQTYVPTAPTV